MLPKIQGLAICLIGIRLRFCSSRRISWCGHCCNNTGILGYYRLFYDGREDFHYFRVLIQSQPCEVYQRFRAGNALILVLGKFERTSSREDWRVDRDGGSEYRRTVICSEIQDGSNKFLEYIYARDLGLLWMILSDDWNTAPETEGHERNNDVTICHIAQFRRFICFAWSSTMFRVLLQMGWGTANELKCCQVIIKCWCVCKSGDQ